MSGRRGDVTSLVALSRNITFECCVISIASGGPRKVSSDGLESGEMTGLSSYVYGIVVNECLTLSGQGRRVEISS
jgi:hypothetical protein